MTMTGPITFVQKGDFSNTERFFKDALSEDYLKVLDKYGQAGVNALASATPKDSGYTASCWNYEIETGNGETSIYFTNSHMNKGVSIAVILQYGHGTRNGGYVRGRDYINPAIQPVFDTIADTAWKEITK